VAGRFNSDRSTAKEIVVPEASYTVVFSPIDLRNLRNAV
jgi:hypothetical protein